MDNSVKLYSSHHINLQVLTANQGEPSTSLSCILGIIQEFFYWLNLYKSYYAIIGLSYQWCRLSLQFLKTLRSEKKHEQIVGSLSLCYWGRGGLIFIRNLWEFSSQIIVFLSPVERKQLGNICGNKVNIIEVPFFFTVVLKDLSFFAMLPQKSFHS